MKNDNPQSILGTEHLETLTLQSQQKFADLKAEYYEGNSKSVERDENLRQLTDDLNDALELQIEEAKKVLARSASLRDEMVVRHNNEMDELYKKYPELKGKFDNLTTDEHVPTQISDPINAYILAVSEDRIQGFSPDPIGEIARLSDITENLVLERIVAMLKAGTIRRVRQTLMAINLAPGALVAWQVPEDKLQSAFDWMFQNDPFTGHVVIRTTDAKIEGARYRLWTTLKVPVGFSMAAHCEKLCELTGATACKLMPAKKVFALGVGHVRRKNMEIGSKADAVAEAKPTEVVELNELDWRVLVALKREFEPEELTKNLWQPRADEAGVSLEEFYRVAKSLEERGVIGRFSTFLEHAKTLQSGERVTKFNALFHWKVPIGREIEAGQQVGRFDIMTHAYWREGGADFNDVNIMGVAHGTDKDRVLEHKRAIDEHLEAMGIPVSYTNVFWGGRSEIKPSEISPITYREWAQSVDLKLD